MTMIPKEQVSKVTEAGRLAAVAAKGRLSQISTQRPGNYNVEGQHQVEHMCEDSNQNMNMRIGRSNG